MATTTFAHLSAPLKLGDLTLRNSNVMASMTRNRCIPTTLPNELNLEYYTQRAKGGAGLIMSEGTLVSPQGSPWPNAPGIWDMEHGVAWRRITESVHKHGALIFCQVYTLKISLAGCNTHMIGLISFGMSVALLILTWKNRRRQENLFPVLPP